ncbi:methionyl-tRNA synthetase [Sporothrix schenckii 1099-18]|uniref:methionine--tRNA ligase n=2 Tax=Sporothrix schenckii TaxID=29908 RepID=U7Q4W2_SPOS1|nr:methionyl-tRNA synthetase [Sporothrix schenckii 1099-18]ERT02060.1 methionine-tRNA ligase [Sporothrix schenckii ATCC 58251]KJR80739.1 methionyl-tRNA synthetase [Sporothrix schenckii 1099-18]
MDRLLMARGLGCLHRPCRQRLSAREWQVGRPLQRRHAATAKPPPTTKPYYVTTPIFYVNADPHIGHLYTMVLADVLKRWQTLLGRKALLCTGTDEHGLKVQQAATRAGVPPKQFCDENASVFLDLARRASIDNDFFIRTTDADHIAAARAFWRRLRRKGYIYQSQHQGWYCVSDETFYPEALVEKRIAPATGKVEMVSTETGKTVEWTEEQNYHFRMTAVRDRLLQFYAENPDFVVPAARMNEVVHWVTHNLEDLSISRPSSRLTWAVPAPEDPSQTIYVWMEALVNYMTKAGYPERWAPEEQREAALEAEAEATESAEAVVIDGNVQANMVMESEEDNNSSSKGRRRSGRYKPSSELHKAAAPLTPEQRQRHEGGGWPVDVHVMGKDIVRFHAVYWPALLLAVDLPLPRRILSHAHWTLGRKKMSKSVGNVVNPFYAMDRFGVDAMRYYLLHDGGIEHDGDYGNEHIVDRYKKGLQGGLGNLLGRITRTTRWSVRETVVRGPSSLEGSARRSAPVEAQIASIQNVAGLAASHMERLDPRQALHAIMDVVYQTNRFLQELEPWSVAKQLATAPTTSEASSGNEALRVRLDQSVYLTAEALRVVGILLQPVMPAKAAEVLDILGVGHGRRSFDYAQLGTDGDYGLPMKPPGKSKDGGLFPPLPVED